MFSKKFTVILGYLFFSSFGYLLCAFTSYTHAHFSVAPKIKAYYTKLSNEESVITGEKSSVFNRTEFLNYLERLTAFDTKYDRVQPKFYAHFNLVRGIALAYPENVHDYIDTLTLLKANPNVYHEGIKSWFSDQAELFTSFKMLHKEALNKGLETSPEYQTVSRFYAAGKKAAFLEELIVLGDMPPTVKGLKEYLSKLADAEKINPATGITQDTELTPADEQQRMKKRWVDFRNDLLATSKIERFYRDVKQANLSKSALMARVEGEPLSLNEFNLHFGLLSDNRFASQKKANSERMIFHLAAAKLYDSLGFNIQKVNTDIETTNRFILIGIELSNQAFNSIDGVRGIPGELVYVRDLQAYPKILEVRDWYTPSISQKVLDEDFFDPVDWVLERSMEPQHSIHL